MNNNTMELIRLIQENPDLPVIPMVYYEIVGEDYGRWIGSFGSVNIGEYIKGDERVYFRDDDDIEEALTGVSGWGAYEKMTDEEAEQAYKQLPWLKAIIVDINLPD